MSSDLTFEKSSDLFQSESSQLHESIESALKSEKLAVTEIIQLYYQVMKVSSISKLLGESFESSDDPKHRELLNKIHDVQKQIVEKFDTKLHPVIVSQLTDSIQTYTDNLQSLAKEAGEKSKETIEAEANQYKELRELMSTKEFVIQYENGLKDD